MFRQKGNFTPAEFFLLLSKGVRILDLSHAKVSEYHSFPEWLCNEKLSPTFGFHFDFPPLGWKVALLPEKKHAEKCFFFLLFFPVLRSVISFTRFVDIEDLPVRAVHTRSTWYLFLISRAKYVQWTFLFIIVFTLKHLKGNYISVTYIISDPSRRAV